MHNGEGKSIGFESDGFAGIDEATASETPSREPGDRENGHFDLHGSDQEFVESIFSADWSLQQYSFEQGEVDQMVERLFAVVEDFVSKDGRYGEKKELYYHDIQSLFFKEFAWQFTPNTRDSKRENVQDQILASVMKIVLSGEHLPTSAAFLGSCLLQQSQMIRLEALYEAGKNLTWFADASFDQNQRKWVEEIDRELMANISYNINFSGDYYAGRLQEQFDATDDTTEQLKILEFVKKCFFSLPVQGYDGSEEAMKSLFDLVAGIANKSDNYFVKTCAEIAVAQMDGVGAYDDMVISPAQDEYRYWCERQNEETLSEYRQAEKDLVISYIGRDRYRDEDHQNWLRRLITDNGFRYKLDDIRRKNPYSDSLCVDLSPGRVGIYSWNGNLQRVQLESGESVALADLPVLGADNNGDRLSQLKEFSLLLSLPMRRVIEEDFNIDLSKLDYSTQYYFLNFLRDRNEKEVRKLADFTGKFGEDGFRVFLALEDGEEMAEVIYKIADDYPESEAKKIFAKYAEIVGESAKVASYIQENAVPDQQLPERAESDIQRNLLSSGRKLLRDAVSEKVKPEELMLRLERTRGDVILYAAVINEMRRQDLDTSSLDLANVRVESAAVGELSEHDKTQMVLISKSNWIERGEKGSQVSEGFESLLKSNEESSKNNFYLVRHKDDVLSFFLLRKESDGSYYCGSLNVSPEAKSTDNLKLLSEIFLEVTADKRVSAKADPKSLVAPLYINQYGFRAVGIQADGTLKIERDLSLSQASLVGKSSGELLKHGVNAEKDTEVRVYTFPDEFEIFRVEAGALFSEMEITNYQFEKYSRNRPYKVIVGFEPKVRAGELAAR